MFGGSWGGVLPGGGGKIFGALDEGRRGEERGIDGFRGTLYAACPDDSGAEGQVENWDDDAGEGGRGIWLS